MTDNVKLIQKADLAVSDLVSDGGYLKDEETDRFIRLAIKQGDLLPLVKVIPMASHTKEFAKTRITQRALRPSTSKTPLAAAADRTAPELSKFSVTAKLYKAEVHLDDETLEDQIEGSAFKDTILSMFTEKIGVDVDDVLINGDTASGDATLATQDGVLKRITANIVDAAGGDLTKTVLQGMIKAMPQEFARFERMKFFTSRNARLDYNDSLTVRETALGDNQIVGPGGAAYHGIPVVKVDGFPNLVGDVTNAVLMDPQDIYLGWWRQMRFETERYASIGYTSFVVTMRWGMNIVHDEMFVKAINVDNT